MATRKHVLHSIHHLITAFVLILKGADKLSHHTIIGSLLLVFGVIVLSYFIYTMAANHQRHYLEILVHWFEAIVCLFMAYIFFSEGKRFLPYVFLAAAAGFIVAIIVHYRKRSAIIDRDKYS